MQEFIETTSLVDNKGDSLGLRELFANNATPLRRLMQTSLGMTYSGERDVYNALGWPQSPDYKTYHGIYSRAHVARRVVEAPVSATWKDKPKIEEVDSDAEETAFEQKWMELSNDKKLKMWWKIKRGDIVSGIGQYGAIFLGFDDGIPLHLPVSPSPNRKLLYMTPLSEEHAQIQKLSSDPTNARFSLPELYNLTFSTASTGSSSSSGGAADSSTTRFVHWTRVLHIGEGFLENDIYGTPRLENVLNLFLGLDLIIGGASEGYWRMGFPGMHFNVDPEYGISEPAKQSLQTQTEAFVHGLQKYIRTTGIEIKTLQGTLSDPSKAFDILMSLIAGAKGYPKRILLGNEAGELASSQDMTLWGELIRERRGDVAEDVILDQFIQRLIDAGTLPKPRTTWTYLWPDLHTPSAMDKAEVLAKNTEAFVKYADSMQASALLPPEFYFEELAHMTPEQMETITRLADERAGQITRENEEIAAQGNDEDD